MSEGNFLPTSFQPVYFLLQDMLYRQLKLILHRVLNAARESPSLVTTAVRIIEREERYDH